MMTVMRKMVILVALFEVLLQGSCEDPGFMELNYYYQNYLERINSSQIQFELYPYDCKNVDNEYMLVKSRIIYFSDARRRMIDAYLFEDAVVIFSKNQNEGYFISFCKNGKGQIDLQINEEIIKESIAPYKESDNGLAYLFNNFYDISGFVIEKNVQFPSIFKSIRTQTNENKVVQFITENNAPLSVLTCLRASLTIADASKINSGNNQNNNKVIEIDDFIQMIDGEAVKKLFVENDGADKVDTSKLFINKTDETDGIQLLK